MNATELLARNLTGNMEFLKMTVADMTDAELLQRPVPAANHPLWQLGHLASAETNLMNSIKPGLMPELPAGFAARFENKKTNHVDDPKQLATKEQVMTQLTKARAATIAYVRTLSDADLEKPSPENMQKFFPKVGDLLEMQATHVTMHVGQIQVARRKLGKPIIF